MGREKAPFDMTASLMTVAVRSFLSVPEERGLERGACGCRAPSGHDLVQVMERLAGGELGEEAQTAPVDAEKRRGPSGEEPRGTKEGAVTADDDDELRFRHKLSTVHAVFRQRAVRKQSDVGKECPYAPLREEHDDVAHQGERAGVVGAYVDGCSFDHGYRLVRTSV